MSEKNLDQWFKDMIGAGLFNKTAHKWGGGIDLGLGDSSIVHIVYDELEARIMANPIHPQDFYKSEKEEVLGPDGPILTLDPSEYTRMK